MFDAIQFFEAPLPWEGSATPPLDAPWLIWEGGQERERDRAFNFPNSRPEIEGFLGVPSEFGHSQVEILRISRLEDISDALQPSAEPKERPDGVRRLQIVSDADIEWSSSVSLNGVSDVILDFSGVRFSGRSFNGALLSLTRCRNLVIKGLVVPEAGTAGIISAQSDTIALIGCVLGSLFGSALSLAGGCHRFVIRNCAFYGNEIGAIEILGKSSNVLVADCHFDCANSSTGVLIRASRTASDFGETLVDGSLGLGRDTLIDQAPRHVFLVENVFENRTDKPVQAVRAEAADGVYMIGNRLKGAACPGLFFSGGSRSLSLLDNHFVASSASDAAVVSFTDCGCIFLGRNTFVLEGVRCVSFTGRNGAILMGMNMFSVNGSDESDGAVVTFGDEAASAEERLFYSTILKGNICRGPASVGFGFQSEHDRLFIYDNQLMGLSDWSISSALPVSEKSVSSENNWSEVPSRNIWLSSGLIRSAVMRISYGSSNDTPA